MIESDNNISNKHLVFTVNSQRYAMPVNIVETVVRIVEIMPIPGAKDYIKGVINFHGDVIPVIDLRHKFTLPDRQIELTDQLIIIQDSNRKFAVMVDGVLDVIQCDETNVSHIENEIADQALLNGVAKVNDGLILLNNFEYLFSSDEIKEIDQLVKQVEL